MTDLPQLVLPETNYEPRSVINPGGQLARGNWRFRLLSPASRRLAAPAHRLRSRVPARPASASPPCRPSTTPAYRLRFRAPARPVSASSPFRLRTTPVHRLRSRAPARPVSASPPFRPRTTPVHRLRSSAPACPPASASALPVAHHARTPPALPCNRSPACQCASVPALPSAHHARSTVRPLLSQTFCTPRPDRTNAMRRDTQRHDATLRDATQTTGRRRRRVTYLMRGL